MAQAVKSPHVELELVDVASSQTIKKGTSSGPLPRAGEIIVLPLGPGSWARYRVLNLEYFMGLPDDPNQPESQTSDFKITIYAQRES